MESVESGQSGQSGDLFAPPSAPAAAARDPAHAVLQTVFGYTQFRDPQQAVIEHVIGGHDCLVLMPTGGGKSLCYQIPAIVRQQQGYGVTLVVSPLIALMQDQVGALHEAGVQAAFLNSTQSWDETRDVLRSLHAGAITLLYAAPERITTAHFVQLLDDLYAAGKLALFAIDEAHCVSQWGHDFRPEYLSLTLLHERYGSVPRIALTATADATTRADIVRQLQLHDARQFVSSFDRPNIRYHIVEKKDGAQQLLRFIKNGHIGHSGIVYCQTRKRVEELAQMLVHAGIAALPYHAGLAFAARQHNQSRFLREDGIVICATIAFGMGIDKPDVRFVAHLDMPKNIEGYYQETGRAGRDGLPSDAWMAYGLQDVVNQRRMIDEGEAGEDFKRIMRAKLDALLALAEACDCRRVRLLGYFGEPYRKPGARDAPQDGTPLAQALQNGGCGNCDNCLEAPAVWDGSDAARKLLSTIYRLHQASRLHFGIGHILDVLRGERTDKVLQHGHEQVSTFGIGKNYSEAQLRSVVRQLLASGALAAQRVTTASGHGFDTLALTAASRAVLRGEQPVVLRQSVAAAQRTRARKPAAAPAAAPGLDAAAQVRFINLKAWRGEVARAHNLPAYVIFHDATLAAIARAHPRTVADLQGIHGMGARKLAAYGEEVLRVLASPA